MFAETAQQEADRLLEEDRARRGLIPFLSDADPGPAPCREDLYCRCGRHDPVPIGIRIERFVDRWQHRIMLAATCAISVLVCAGIGQCGR